MSDTLVMVGTRKGLWIGRSDEARRDWSWTGPHFPMEEVYSCMIDTRGASGPRLLAGASSSWLGPQVWRSDDLGETWQETPNGAVRFPEDTDAAVARVWQLVPGVEGVQQFMVQRENHGGNDGKTSQVFEGFRATIFPHSYLSPGSNPALAKSHAVCYAARR